MNPKTDHPVAAQQSEERREGCPYCNKPIVDCLEDGGYVHMDKSDAYECPGKFPEPSIPTETRQACKFGDPGCPCQDGDPCHYEDHGDTKAMEPPTETREPEIPAMDVKNEDVFAALAYIRGIPEDEEVAITRVRLQNMHSRVSCRERQLREAGDRIARSETREKMLEDALGKLLETHCCDTGEADYQTEWLDENTTVCDVCRAARALERKV